jgi:hypothetical protein
MTDLRKAANTALYALETNYPLIEDYGNKEQLDIHHEAIMDLYKALTQPEQEPVDIHCPSFLHSFSIVPVAKREWVGLTDDEITKIMQRWRNGYIDIKDVEQLLKEKNT